MRSLVLALASLLTLPVIAFAAPPQPTIVPNNPVVVLDPGHGGTDTGSTECPGLYEKTANLDIANRVKALLEPDYVVYLTRTSNDQTLSNNDRYTFANSVGGNALVAVHLNGSTNHSVNGTQGFWGKKNKDEAFTRTVHQALVGSLGIPDRGVTNFPSGVLLKSKMPATLQETVFISNTTECQLLTNGDGVRQQEIAEALAQGIRNWFGK